MCSSLTNPVSVCVRHQDDKVRPEDEMAQRKAALMEKQQKRAEEMKRRRLEQEEKSEKEHAMCVVFSSHLQYCIVQ